MNDTAEALIWTSFPAPPGGPDGSPPSRPIAYGALI